MKTFKGITEMYVNGLKGKVVFMDMEDKSLESKLGFSRYHDKTIYVGIHETNTGHMLLDRTAKVLMHEIGHAYMHSLPIEECFDASSQSEYIANVGETAYLYSEYADKLVFEAHKWGKNFEKSKKLQSELAKNEEKVPQTTVIEEDKGEEKPELVTNS